MDRQQVGLKLTVDALDLSSLFELKSFSDRLILQKTVYLAQSAGVQLGYHFNWYLRGPYSPGLTKDAFAISTEFAEAQDELAGWNLDPESQQLLRNLSPLFAQTSNKDALAHKLEVMASTLFLLKQGRARHDSPEELQAVLKRFGKDFELAQIHQALEELRRYGLWPK